jgi:predicted transcriptional regulator with HTH domain
MTKIKTHGRETVGKISSDLLNKTPYSTDPIEIERAMHEDYEKNVFDCLEDAKKKYVGDFFVVVLTKKERLMENVLRHYFFARKSCPTPDYDQTVYQYHANTENLIFLWVIPSKEACITFMEQASSITPEEWGLLGFVLQFADGTLFKIAKMLNNEQPDTPELIQ